MKIITILTILIATAFLVSNLAVGTYAQDSDDDIVLDVDDQIGLQPIEIAFFPQANIINSEYATILSWLSFAANLAIIGLILFWVYRILVAGVGAIKSEGEAEGLAEAWKRSRSVLLATGLTFLIPIVLSVIGAALQVGAIWDWPLAFRSCEDDRYDYYFQAVQAFEEEGIADRNAIDNICF